MFLIEFALLLVIAGIAGAIGKALAGYRRGGCAVTVALGFIGALVGTWMARAMDLPQVFTLQVGRHPFPLAWSILGATLFLVVLGFLTRDRQPPDPDV
jgi:uncharacterized membrane protein YeaQ/YmgE (transglycosylase-associated protein family)